MAKKVSKKPINKKENEPELVRTGEFGKRVGVTKQTVLQAIKSGRLTSFTMVGREYRIDVEKGLKEWDVNTNKKMQAKVQARENAKKIVTRAAKNKKGFEDSPEGPRTYNGMTTADAERQEKFYKAELAKLKFEEQAGQLMETEKVKKAAFEVGRKIRDNIMSIAAKHSHELAAETDPHKTEVMLSKMLNDALGEIIAVDFEKLKRQS